jgi:hypothetical protein
MEDVVVYISLSLWLNMLCSRGSGDSWLLIQIHAVSRCIAAKYVQGHARVQLLLGTRRRIIGTAVSITLAT